MFFICLVSTILEKMPCQELAKNFSIFFYFIDNIRYFITMTRLKMEISRRCNILVQRKDTTGDI